MKIKKKEINEIIDSHGDLIGSNGIPQTGADLETQASNTTDYNAKIGTQPFRYDMLGRFGFTLMPFMEGEDKNQGQAELENDLVDLMNERYLDLLKHYKRNPQRIQSDYRKHITDGEISDETMSNSIKWAEKILKIVEDHFGKAFSQIEKIDEGKVIEDKMLSKKEDTMPSKSEDGEIRDKKLEKIAGLINRLEKKDIDKLINLLEAKETKEETEFSAEEKKEISDFVSNYKGDFKDEDIHKLGEKLGLEIPEVEEFIYNLARKGIKKD